MGVREYIGARVGSLFLFLLFPPRRIRPQEGGGSCFFGRGGGIAWAWRGGENSFFSLLCVWGNFLWDRLYSLNWLFIDYSRLNHRILRSSVSCPLARSALGDLALLQNTFYENTTGPCIYTLYFCRFVVIWVIIHPEIPAIASLLSSLQIQSSVTSPTSRSCMERQNLNHSSGPFSPSLCLAFHPPPPRERIIQPHQKPSSPTLPNPTHPPQILSNTLPSLSSHSSPCPLHPEHPTSSNKTVVIRVPTIEPRIE